MARIDNWTQLYFFPSPSITSTKLTKTFPLLPPPFFLIHRTLITKRTQIMSSCLCYLLIIAALCSLGDAQYCWDTFPAVDTPCKMNSDCGNATCPNLCGARMKCCHGDDAMVPASQCHGADNGYGTSPECCSGQCYAKYFGTFLGHLCRSETEVIALNTSNSTGTPWGEIWAEDELLPSR